MHTPLQFRAPSLAALCALATSSASAAIVVNFDGTNSNAFSAGSTGSVTFANSTLSTTSVANDTATFTSTLNTSTPTYATGLAVTGGTYVGPSLYMGIYSRMQTTVANNVGSAGSLQNGGTGADSIRVRRVGNTANSIAVTQRHAVLLDAVGIGDYAFDANSVLTISSGYGGLNVSSTGWSADNRWLVLHNNSIYVSQSTIGFNATTGASGTFTLNNPDEINWALWSPNATLDNLPGSYSIAGSSLNKITAVGYYVTKNWSGAAANIDPGTVTTTFFSADLTAVPEPSTFAVFAGLGAAGFATVRRRRRTA